MSLHLLQHKVLLSPEAGFMQDCAVDVLLQWLRSGEGVYNCVSLGLFLVVCSEILNHRTFWLFNRGHTVKITHTYLKIYGLTWLSSLGSTQWVSHSEWKPNVSVFRVYSFCKHSTYASCSCYSERFFFPNIWEICVSGVFSVDSLIERKSDAGPLSRSIYQSVWKNFK